MKAKVLALKSRLFGGGGTASGVLGGIGSIHNVCHSLCVSVVSILAIFGITTQILPLMFLQTYQLYFWIAALIFTIASFYFYLQQKHPVTRDRNLLLINTGLLLFGLPFTQVVDYIDFFRFIGGSLAIMGVFLFFFGKKFQLAYRPVVSVKESQTKASDAVQQIAGGSSTIKLPKLTIQSTLFVIVIGGFLINQYFMYKMGIFDKTGSQVGSVTTSLMKPLSRMELTPFDVVLAKEQIGVLGSQHIHADFKVYINGQALDFAKPEYYMKSSFIHVDNNPNNKEDASGVLHMHATKVPLDIFFRSLGMNLTKDSLTLTDGRVLKKESGNTLNFYLDGKKVDELVDYVFQDLDKLLISYGPENDPDIERQIKSITNFAKDH